MSSCSALVVFATLALAAHGQLITMCGDCRLTVERGSLVISYTAATTGMCSCRSLNVRAAGLTFIDNATFSAASFPRLQVLDLSENQITEIAPRAFAGLERLEWLDLSFNILSTVTPGTFHGLSSLRILYLNRNRLLYVEKAVWADVERLWHMQLHLNPGAPFATCPPCSAASLGCRREAVELPVFRVGAKSVVFTFLEEQASVQVKQNSEEEEYK